MRSLILVLLLAGCTSMPEGGWKKDRPTEPGEGARDWAHCMDSAIVARVLFGPFAQYSRANECMMAKGWR